MRLIGFKAKWIEPIQSGAKSTTIRPADRPLPTIGEVVGMRCRYDQPPFAYAEILSVEPLEPDALTDDAARADGHPSARSLRDALGALYGRRALATVRFRTVYR